jgi:hypothetical protein
LKEYYENLFGLIFILALFVIFLGGLIYIGIKCHDDYAPVKSCLNKTAFQVCQNKNMSYYDIHSDPLGPELIRCYNPEHDERCVINCPPDFLVFRFKQSEIDYCNSQKLK